MFGPRRHVFGLCAMLGASLAHLAPSSAAEHRRRLAVPDVRTVGAFDPQTVAGLSSLVASEATSRAFKVISGADIATLVGFERQKSLLGCTSSSCLAEAGGALGCDWLLSTEVAEVGGTWLVTSTLLDTRHAQALSRVTLRTSRLAELVDVTQKATSRALDALSPKEKEKEERPPAVAVTAPKEPGPAMSPLRATGFALVGVGGVAVVTGIVFGVKTKSSYEAAQDAADLATFEDAKTDGKRNALIADVMYGVGVAAAAAGAALIVLGGSDAPATATVAPTRGGVAAALSGRF